jgi:glycosyltransferase involved in cell wall biosynthesis
MQDLARKDNFSRDLSIIVPAFNEGKLIFKTINEIENTMENLGLDYEVIVVDDGSKDNTYEEARKAAKSNPRVKVVRKENGGKGSALKYGFNFCSGKLVTFIDADLDLHPRQIPLFIKYMKKYNADVVVGSKRHPLSKIKYPSHRKFLSRVYQIIVAFLFRLNVRDTQAGLKLFKYEVLKEVFPKVLCKKYAFDLELLVNANHRGFKIVEAPVELNWQRVASRIKFKDIFRIALDTAAIFYRLRILKWYDGEKK